MTEESLLVGNDGKVAVPGSPGLGVHLNEDTVGKYRV
jgi:L-alanine-DL-glutamate epimerase-like enolase superfamily enzyme